MRHTHATLLLLQGVNPKIVSERLGHADVRITLDTYSYLLPSMQKDTAIKFGEMLFGEDDKYYVEINLD
jgi:integrase